MHKAFVIYHFINLWCLLQNMGYNFKGFLNPDIKLINSLSWY